MKNPLLFLDCIIWTITTAFTIQFFVDGLYFAGSIASLIVVISGIRTWRRFAESIFEKEEPGEISDIKNSVEVAYRAEEEGEP